MWRRHIQALHVHFYIDLLLRLHPGPLLWPGLGPDPDTDPDSCTGRSSAANERAVVVELDGAPEVWTISLAELSGTATSDSPWEHCTAAATLTRKQWRRRRRWEGKSWWEGFGREAPRGLRPLAAWASPPCLGCDSHARYRVAAHPACGRRALPRPHARLQHQDSCTPIDEKSRSGGPPRKV